jgi:hypothetical protein
MVQKRPPPPHLSRLRKRPPLPDLPRLGVVLLYPTHLTIGILLAASIFRVEIHPTFGVVGVFRVFKVVGDCEVS